MNHILKKITICFFLTLMIGTAIKADISTLNTNQNSRFIKVYLPPFFPNTEPWVKHFSSQEEWRAFYQKATEKFTSFPSPPIYDFENYDLIIGGVGPKGGSYLLLVEDVDYSFEQTHIFLHEISYPNCRVFIDFGIENPSSTPQAILVKKTTKPINFYFRSTVVQSNCPSRFEIPSLILP